MSFASGVEELGKKAKWRGCKSKGERCLELGRGWLLGRANR